MPFDLHRSTAQSFRVSGSKRKEYMQEVWDMYTTTYKSIGLHVPSPQALLKYDVWEFVPGSGGILAFGLYKKTRFGLKSGAGGHNGTREGKKAAVKLLQAKFHRSGVYGEVSHKVLDIVRSAEAPAICAAFVLTLTGKGTKVNYVRPLEYEREIKGVGRVTKVMVGRPRGIPTTTFKNPQCPVTDIPLKQRSSGLSDCPLSWGDVSPEDSEMFDRCADVTQRLITTQS